MKQTIEYYYSLKLDKLFIEGDAYHFILDDSDNSDITTINC